MLARWLDSNEGYDVIYTSTYLCYIPKRGAVPEFARFGTVFEPAAAGVA
jgi:hypothetical protein